MGVLKRGDKRDGSSLYTLTNPLPQSPSRPVIYLVAAYSPQFGEIVITDEPDRLFNQDAADTRIAQGAQLCFALDAIASRVIRIYITWMTAQFRDTVADLHLNHHGEFLCANLLKVRLASPLTVKLREVLDRRMFAQRQPMFPRQFEKMRQGPWVTMIIVV